MKTLAVAITILLLLPCLVIRACQYDWAAVFYILTAIGWSIAWRCADRRADGLKRMFGTN
jgi:hypothetical protein